jgi:hypothetical protein
MGVTEAATFPGREDTSQVRLLHDLAKTHASFDDPHLVSRAGLVPVMALAQRAGLSDLVEEHVRPGGPCGVNACLKTGCLVAGMIGGAGICWVTISSPPTSWLPGSVHSTRSGQSRRSMSPSAYTRMCPGIASHAPRSAARSASVWVCRY